MKKCLFFSLIFLFSLTINAQEQLFPAVKNGGGVYAVPEAENIGEWKQPYKIVSESFYLESTPRLRVEETLFSLRAVAF